MGQLRKNAAIICVAISGTIVLISLLWKLTIVPMVQNAVASVPEQGMGPFTLPRATQQVTPLPVVTVDSKTSLSLIPSGHFIAHAPLSDSTATEMAHWQTYLDPRFSIKYPQGWFVSDPGVKYGERHIVFYSNVPGPHAALDVSRVSTVNISLVQAVNDLLDSIKRYDQGDQIQRSDILLNGIPATKIKVSHNGSIATYIVLQHNDGIYTLQEDFQNKTDSNDAVFVNFFNSFRLY